MDLSKFTLQKINELRENLNLTDDELEVFNMLAKHKSVVEISQKTQISVSSVHRRIRNIKNKMQKLGEL